ncbi:MAG: CRISPR system precrRNA processing endoribonuclease RAMP protein Cas6 [Chloroflexi bacterium]|nr:CRISPR system precrRNA processing endoribonuclease RAMP protein Cas6 [Chloroflexota bacterium]
MPSSLTFTLAARDQNLPDNCIPALHATFFQWLERGDVEIARRVHDEHDPKPYTASPLTRDGDIAHFRITLLDDALLPALQTGIDQQSQVRIVWATLAFADAPRVAQKSYAQIANEADETPNITLRFESPTSFRSHDMHYPLPDPVMVFASYHARWNAFAPEPLRISEAWLEWLQHSVAVTRFDLESRAVKFKDFVQIGCVGTVQYSVMQHQTDRGGVAPLNALATYAEFCGTGHKTTQGMGQTRRLD